MPVSIRTNDPRMAVGISEGVNAVALQRVNAEYERLKALRDVRAWGDDRRWKYVQRRLAMKYYVRPVGRVTGTILGVWALVWYEVFEWANFLRRWNRG